MDAVGVQTAAERCGAAASGGGARKDAATGLNAVLRREAARRLWASCASMTPRASAWLESWCSDSLLGAVHVRRGREGWGP